MLNQGLNFSHQDGKSYYYNTINLFLNDDSNRILGELVKNSFNMTDEQREAWINQINQLKDKLSNSKCSGDIIFEYDIVRLGKRIDVILLIKHMVFSLEFKNGAKQYLARDAEQAEDYALDLKNFHKESENLYVCPILVATEAKEYKNIIDSYDDKQVKLQFANSDNIYDVIDSVAQKYGEDKSIDFNSWYNSPYCPTPTIIEAATEAYMNHTVSNIAHSEAGQINIDLCENQISKIVNYAKINNKKCICFVTGVPGAGKTLVGLDIASKNLSVEENTKAVYISGNGPLIKVLRKSLINNAVERTLKDKNNKEKKKEEKKYLYLFKRLFKRLMHLEKIC